MGIPIKRYIDISTTTLNTFGSNRDYSGLLFTTESISTDAPDDIKTAYNAGDAISLSMSEVIEYFSSLDEDVETSKVVMFANKYFGVTDAFGRTPSALKVVKYSGTKSAAFTSVIAKESNFGAFCFDDVGSDGDVASANANLGRQYVYVCGHASSDPVTGVVDVSGCHFMKVSEWSDLAYVVGWVATRDYDRANAAGTIDYTEFAGATPTVSTDSGKTTCDSKRINYIGHVQQRGINRSFYQTGVNMDGLDLGVYCDSAWMQSEIEAGWINLALGASKIPANQGGMMRVRAMIVSVAERGINNGCILIEKPLTDDQQTEINAFANDEGAATAVMTNGYFVSTNLYQDSAGKYVVEYVLIYSKGDHIAKIVGTHALV